MNSTALQQKYPEVYQKFFLKCPIVVSVPLTFYWTEHPSHYSGIMVRQKIPLKVFVGAEFIPEQRIDFGNIIFFSIHNNRFLYEDLNEFFPNVPELRTFLQNEFHKCSVLRGRAIRLHVLVEDTIYGYPNGIRSSICASLASMIRLLSGNLTIEQISSWKTLSAKYLLHDEKYGFQETFQLARVINLIDSYCHSWTTVCFSAMVPTAYPIISFPGSTIRTLDYQYHKKSNFTTVREIPFWGYDLRDIYTDMMDMIDTPLVWPIDFAVIYSGKSIFKGYGKLKTAYTDFSIKKIQQFINENFASDIKKSSVLPYFYQKFHTNYTPVDYFTTDLFSILSIRLVDQIHKLLSQGYNDSAIYDFINLIHSRHASLVGADPMSDYMRNLFHNLNAALFHANSSANFAFFAMYDVSLGGNIGFVSPLGTHRQALENAVETLQKEYPDLSIEYLSWRDGYCSDGVIVEQYMDQSIVSKHLGKNLLRVSEYGKDSHQEKLLPDNATGSSEEKSDLTLNLLENTIMIAGQPISSKELHSQTATVHVLNLLLTSSHRQIKNTELHRSAYSVSKNEMQGKITGPLCRLIEERTGKKLEIVLKGTNQEFSIMLKVPHNFVIRTVQKMFE